jgi:DNA polymerase-3 subunit epsilon
MAFEWLTGSTPQFWKNYLTLFESENMPGYKRYVVFDIEATGLDWKDDTILSIGAIALHENAIAIGDFFSVRLNDKNAKTTSVALGDSLENDNDSVVEAEAMIQFLNFIKDAVLVGHNVNLDIEMINQALKRLELGRLKNNVMDTNVLFQRWRGVAEETRYTVDEICEALKIEKPNRHTSWGNAYTTALIFLKLKQRLKI